MQEMRLEFEREKMAGRNKWKAVTFRMKKKKKM